MMVVSRRDVDGIREVQDRFRLHIVAKIAVTDVQDRRLSGLSSLPDSLRLRFRDPSGRASQEPTSAASVLLKIIRS